MKEKLDYSFDVRFVPVEKGDLIAWRAALSLLLQWIREDAKLKDTTAENEVESNQCPEEKTPSCK